MKITVARNSGFCFGVKRAVEMALEAAKTEDDVIMLGDIVHNEHVIDKIDKAGVKVVDKLNGNERSTILLRAHGTVPQTYDDANAHNMNIIDATCPLVLEIHEIVRELEREGYRIIVIGDYEHDEVNGIVGQVQDAIVIDRPEHVMEKITKHYQRFGVVVQSTQNVDNAKAIIAELIPFAKELKFMDTICAPTKSYQRDIRTMPTEHDVMIIVGSFTSANTKRLAEISQSLNPKSYQVESKDDVKAEWFTGIETVGVTAGASTPDWIIQEVVEQITVIGSQS